jgi:hypothetical protein
VEKKKVDRDVPGSTEAINLSLLRFIIIEKKTVILI